MTDRVIGIKIATSCVVIALCLTLCPPVGLTFSLMKILYEGNWPFANSYADFSC